jgi:hypothetical protein
MCSCRLVRTKPDSSRGVKFSYPWGALILGRILRIRTREFPFFRKQILRSAQTSEESERSPPLSRINAECLRRDELIKVFVIRP